ncbi:MAG TPA: winged helix DNA-binding protein [Microlunatus sp.]|nr:winged helix DNA-binding protein [Microlunatus sp.]
MSRISGAEAAVLAFSYEIKRLVVELNGALAATFRPLGLTCVKADALMALEQLGPVSLNELAGHLVAESGHPSRLISTLDAEGLVTRTRSDRDRRAVLISLTDRGRDLARRAREARQPLVAEFARRHGGDLDQVTERLRDVRDFLAGRADPDGNPDQKI